MSIDVRTVDDDEWNDIVTDSPHATPLHRAEGLEVLAAHADVSLHRLVGFKGQEPVGVFPVFTVSKGPMTAAVSPPPDLKVHYLGPAMVNFRKLKRRKLDQRNQGFVTGVLDRVDEEVSPNYWNVRTPVGYDDSRPFAWNEFDVTPRFTYVVDLEPGTDELLARFSSDARHNVTAEYDVDYRVREEGPEAIDRVVAQTTERHREQGEPFPLTASFVRDLYDRLPEGTVRPYALRIDGEFVGGRIVLEGDRRAAAWIGGAKTDAPVPVNDLLDWQVCVDAADRGRSSYDLVGANHERIFPYKAKFAPDLRIHYGAEKGSRTATAASKLYKRFL